MFWKNSIPTYNSTINLDFCGDTKAAIQRYNSKYLNPIFWDNSPPLPVQCIVSVNGSELVKKEYFNVIIKYPIYFIKTKIDIWETLYGMNGKQLENIRRGVHGVDDFTKSYGGRQSNFQDLARSSYFSFSDRFLLTYKPIYSLIASLIAVAVIYLFRKEIFLIFLSVFVFSNIYYAGFLINSQAAEFRYFAPTFFLNLILSVAAIVLALRESITKIKCSHA